MLDVNIIFVALSSFLISDVLNWKAANNAGFGASRPYISGLLDSRVERASPTPVFAIRNFIAVPAPLLWECPQ